MRLTPTGRRAFVSLNEQFLRNLRDSWTQIARTQADNLDGFPAFLDKEIDKCIKAHHLDEEHLTDAVSHAQRYLEDHGEHGKAISVSKALLKSLFEYLLAIDAVSSKENAPGSSEMIGIEETISRDSAPTPPAPAPPAPPPVEEALLPHLKANPANEELSRQKDENLVSLRNGFHLAHPNDLDVPVSGAEGMEVTETTGKATAPHKETYTQPPPTTPTQAPALETTHPSPATQSEVPIREEKNEASPVTGALGAKAPTASVPTSTAGNPINQSSWNIRSYDGKLESVHELTEREQAADEQAALHGLRSEIEKHIQQKHCDIAASILQHVALQTGGTQVAELALDTGDRCRALKKKHAALNCYLAAMKADPLHLPALSRLADACIDYQDMNTAVSYLERAAHIMRLRGDTQEALRMYRKISTLAPHREDILELLMKARTTGRLE